MKKLYMLFIALIPILAGAQVLSWNFNGAAGNEAAISASSKDANLSSSSISRGSGVSATALANAFSSSGWNVASEALAISGNKYFQFTVNAAAGYQASLSTLNVYFRRSSTGPNAFQWQYSLDGFASAGIELGSNISYTLTTTGGDPQAQIDLGSISALQNVANSSTISFRLYGWGASASGGTFALGRPAGASLSIGGTVSPVSGSGPSVSVSPSALNPFSAIAGTPSAAQAFTVSGANLTGDISISFPAAYEISSNGGTNYSSTSPLTLTQTGGTVNNTNLSIRINAGAPAGPANGNLTISSAGATNQQLALTGTVSSGVVVNPPASFAAAPISATEIDLSATGNAAGDNILVATNSTADFGTPAGAPAVGNTISGGGTVLYNGPSASFSFAHTGLNPGTHYYYQAWSVDGSNNYSTALSANASTNNAPAANVVINQVYGGGGNNGATYKNDFIELYNNETTPVSLSGWSVQYSSAGGTGNWQVHALSGSIPAHGFFLIQEAAGAGGTVNLPSPDLTGGLAISSTAGKVLLSNSITPQNGANPAGAEIMDKVGFGTAATGFETSPAPATENTTSVQRVTDGADNNNNSTDFIAGAPIPRNSGYTTTAPGISSLTPPNGAADIPYNLNLAINFDKKIVKGSGSITIYENGVAGAPIDVNDAGVVITNNIHVAIPAVLSAGKSYYVLITPGAFADVYGNNFAGISGTTGWAFSTYNSAVATPLPASFDFQNCTGNGLLPNGFTQYSVSGAQVWDCTAFGRDPDAPAGTAAFPNAVQMNGYANNINNLNKDWLISPRLNLAGTDFPLLSFWSRNAFDGDQLELKISTDYTGSGDPALANWTDLNGKFPSKGSDTWTQSGGINLSAFKQNGVYIAFVYSSTTENGSRWSLDDISLINSSTPPPPSLTLSSSNLQFGYTATGSNSTKTLILTANDLVGDVTLSTTGNFQVSADNGASFGNSATITQALANNVPQTLLVRFAPATNNVQYNETLSVVISDSTGTVNLQGNSIDPASTLNVVNWNLNWFATPNQEFGPANKSLQQDNVAIVLKSLPADLFVLQEVVNRHALDSIVNTMPGYGYIINDYGSYSNPHEPTADPLTEVQKLAFVYKTAKFSNIHTDSLLSKGVLTANDLGNPYYNAFASGRFPYMMTADVTLSDNNGGFITHTMRFINIHGKANTAPVQTAYDRRLKGAQGLDSLIKADYINENLLILGDFNDDLNQTITAGITPPLSSYSPFTIDDAGLYIFPTKPLSPAGQHSDVSFTSVIDNVIATAATAKYYLPASATVLSDVANLVPKYGTTTTDHYPVFTQFSFSTAAALPVKLTSFRALRQNETVKLSWSTAQEENSQLFDVERSRDGSSFTKIGTVKAQGSSSVNTDYSFYDQQPLSGYNYYRLRQVDKDGRYTNSAIVKVNFTREPGIRISPNPASGFLYIGLENINSTASLQIFDLNGRLIKLEQITQGTVNKSISLAGMVKGLYTVKLISAEKLVTKKLVVQ